MTHDIIGVDIAKDWIDIHHLSDGQSKRLATTRSALARFATEARGALVVFEASGGYERPLTEALSTAGGAFARVNPRQAREFARATGRLAKTDRVDAAMLAEMGRALRLKPSPVRAPERVRLADLMARRDDLSDMLRREANRIKQARDAWIKNDIKTMLRVLERRLVRVEAEISAQIEAHEVLARAAARLQSMPGIGPRSSPPAWSPGCLNWGGWTGAPSRLWQALRRMPATAAYSVANGGSGAAAPRSGAASISRASSQAATTRASGHSARASKPPENPPKSPSLPSPKSSSQSSMQCSETETTTDQRNTAKDSCYTRFQPPPRAMRTRVHWVKSLI